MKAANTIVEEKSITDSTSSGDESSASCQSGTNNKPRTSTNQRRKLRFLTTSTDTDNDTIITDGKMSGDIITSDKNFITEVKNDYIDNSSTSTPLIGENSNKLDTKSASKVNSPTHSELESL